MKIGIYFNNNGISEVNVSSPSLGNPGVGGTEYCFLLLIESIKKFTNFDLIVYLKHGTTLPQNADHRVVGDVVEAVRRSKIDGCDFIIIRNQVFSNIYNEISAIDQKIIIWGHNFYLSEEADKISSTSNIALNIFVGRQQYDRYLDHDIIKKSTFIFNMVPDVGCVKRENNLKTVVYVGALVKAKGFHILAKQWKKIIKNNPSAKLKVIGNNKVYDRGRISGAHGFSDDKYERIFMANLKNEQGDILDSVEFLGLMGAEKRDVFRTSSVGVVNPSGKTETFGMGVIEMNQCFLPVVSTKKLGLIDTICHGVNGLFSKKGCSLYKQINFLLSNKELNDSLGVEAKKWANNFIPENIIKTWEENFYLVHYNKKIEYAPPVGNYFSNFKFLRVIIRFLRVDLNISFLPSVVSLESFVWHSIEKIKSLVRR